MKDGICPKCRSTEVYVDNAIREGITPIQNFVINPPHLYVCADCGYLEFYVLTGFDLSKVKEKFRKVKS